MQKEGLENFSGLYSHLPKAAPNKKEFLSFYIFLLDQGPIAPLCNDMSQVQIPIQIIVFDELELIIFVSQGLTL